MDWKYEEGRIYSENEKNELIAEVTYVKRENGEINIDQVYVAPDSRGQGIASKAMRVAADFMKENGFKVTATCTYANPWLKKHEEEYKDIISNSIEDETVACKLFGRH